MQTDQGGTMRGVCFEGALEISALAIGLADVSTRLEEAEDTPPTPAVKQQTLLLRGWADAKLRSYRQPDPNPGSPTASYENNKNIQLPVVEPAHLILADMALRLAAAKMADDPFAASIIAPAVQELTGLLVDQGLLTG